MIQWVVERLLRIIEQQALLERDQRDLRDAGLRAISQAINETYLYYRDFHRRGRDLELEAQLSRQWAAAAIPIRHVDLSLAEICERKAEYWVNPQAWGAADVKSVGIALADVRMKYRTLLYPGLQQLSSRTRYKRGPSAPDA